MARDAYEAQAIWKNHDIKVQGPPTTTPGLYSGVLYYYLLAIPYSISNGDPKVAAIFLSLISSLSIIPIFLLAKDLLKSNPWAYLAALLFAISFEATQYGPWLSNPSPAIFTIACFFYSLRLWQKNNKWGLPLAVLFASFSAQLEFFLIFLFVVILLFKYFFKIKFKFTELFLSLIIFLGLMSTFLISMIRFNTFSQVLQGFLSIGQAADISFRIKFTDFLFIYINRFSDLFINNFFPLNVLIGGILGFSVLVILAKHSDKFILFTLLSYIPIFLFGGQNAPYTTVGMVVPAILGVSLLLQIIFKKDRKLAFLAVTLILFANLYMILKINPHGQLLLVIPKQMLLKNQLNLIDETYQEADGKQFSINTLTLPLWTNTSWAYLYSWYGQKKYGYLPSFYGRDQIGLLGADDLQKIDKPLSLSFFIIEPQIGIPQNFYNQEISTEDGKTKLVESFKFDGLTLERRQPK